MVACLATHTHTCWYCCVRTGLNVAVRDVFMARQVPPHSREMKQTFRTSCMKCFWTFLTYSCTLARLTNCASCVRLSLHAFVYLVLAHTFADVRVSFFEKARRQKVTEGRSDDEIKTIQYSFFKTRRYMSRVRRATTYSHLKSTVDTVKSPQSHVVHP